MPRANDYGFILTNISSY